MAGISPPSATRRNRFLGPALPPGGKCNVLRYTSDLAGAARRVVFAFGIGRAGRLARRRTMQTSDVNLYLVGFMGTGKTTIGRGVAQRLGFQLLDSDHEIERQQGRTIPEIFATVGEAAFRALE